LGSGRRPVCSLHRELDVYSSGELVDGHVKVVGKVPDATALDGMLA